MSEMPDQSARCANPETRLTCQFDVCDCPREADCPYCSDYCQKANQDGRLQAGPCHCGGNGCC